MRVPNLQAISQEVIGLPGQANADALMRAARRAAGTVRLHAARSHAVIGIRVSTKSDGVRVTITGRDAQRYRALMQTELERVMPDARAEIRAMITRRPK